jgi:hypothetical protein
VVARLVRTFEGIRVSTEDWPVILIEFPEEAVTESAIGDSLNYLEQLYKEGRQNRERSYTVTDLTRMRQFAPASQRKIVSEWMSRTLDLQKTVCDGGANVTPSAILRGLVTALYWFAPPPVPAIFVATRREAYAEALKAFDGAKVVLRPDLRAALTTRK